MAFYKRFLLGGLGALSIIILWSATTDLDLIIKNVKVIRSGGDDAFALWVGFFVRVIGLFVSGGIAVGVFNADEDRLPKLFQLGMAGPAILAGFLGVNGLGQQSAEMRPNRAATHVSLIAVAHAESPQPVRVSKYPSLRVSAGQQFLAGLFANKAVEKKFYVIVGSREDKDDAVKLAQEYAKKFPQFSYVVYEPYQSAYYGVSIGDSTSFQDAEELRRKAVKAGFPDGAYLKAVP
jgi:hypothetical protein